MEKSVEHGNQKKAIVYFVRHGESVANKSLTFLHPDKDVLNENGKLQAQLLGQYFGNQNERFTMAFSSSFSRALETARIILSCTNRHRSEGSKQGPDQSQNFESDVKHPVTLVEDPRLIERDMGAADGEKIEGPLKEFQEFNKPFVEWDRKGAESPEECNHRISSFFDDLLEMIDRKEEPQKILVVSHATYFLHMAKFLMTNPKKFQLEGETPDYIKAMKNSAFFKVAIHTQRQSKGQSSKSEYNPSLCATSKVFSECRARPIEILTWNATDHLKEQEGHFNADPNSSTGATKEFARTSACAFNLVANTNTKL